MPCRPDTESNYRMHKQTSVMTEMPFFHTAAFPGLFLMMFFLRCTCKLIICYRSGKSIFSLVYLTISKSSTNETERKMQLLAS